jgi:hypothetical protein
MAEPIRYRAADDTHGAGSLDVLPGVRGGRLDEDRLLRIAFSGTPSSMAWSR